MANSDAVLAHDIAKLYEADGKSGEWKAYSYYVVAMLGGNIKEAMSRLTSLAQAGKANAQYALW